jgi:hypothetical protein
MIELKRFRQSIDKFDELESRTDFFTLAKNLLDKGFETEGLLLILTTWNFAVFRYAVKTFDLDKFRQVLQKIEPHFQRFKNEEFSIINFDNFTDSIREIYTSLSQIKGVEYTGTPKLMHLKCPQVFIMWDAYIRGEKPQKYYKKLEVYQIGEIKYRLYGKDYWAYIEFLKDMQTKFAKLPLGRDRKPLTKAIDEYNYVNITLEYQKLEKQMKLQKIKDKNRLSSL